jgi:hypothetical protein
VVVNLTTDSSYISHYLVSLSNFPGFREKNKILQSSPHRSYVQFTFQGAIPINQTIHHSLNQINNENCRGTASAMIVKIRTVGVKLLNRTREVEDESDGVLSEVVYCAFSSCVI